jgi:hypothetical protein
LEYNYTAVTPVAQLVGADEKGVLGLVTPVTNMGIMNLD